MIKNVFTFLMSLLYFPTFGEKICTDIWTMDNNVNGVTLYKVSLHMCTEGIISPNLNNLIFLDPSLADHNFNSSLLNLTNLTLNNQSVIINTPSPTENTLSSVENTSYPTENTSYPTENTSYPTENTPSPTENTSYPTENTPSPTENTPEPIIINNEIIESHEQNSLFFNSTNNTNITNKSNNLEPVHIVLISVSSIIILLAMTIITYIIIKKHHTCCKNKICIEENKQNPNKTSLYKEDKQNNIKLTINTQTKKLRAVERFKNPKKPIPIRKSRFKTAIKNINNAKNINNTKKKTNYPLKYPPGMDADQKTKQLPHLPTTPPPSPPLKVTKPIGRQSKLIENGHDIV